MLGVHVQVGAASLLLSVMDTRRGPSAVGQLPAAARFSVGRLMVMRILADG